MKLIWELFLCFLKVGTFTFGGGLAMLPVIRKAVVEEKGWLSDEEMVTCFAICQSLPGVLAVNTAIYIGHKKKGIKGAVATTAGVTLPAFTAIIVILLFLGQIENSPYVQGALEGVKAATVALILLAACQMGKRIFSGKLGYFIALLAFVMIVAGISAVWAIVAGGAIGYLAYVFRHIKERKHGKGEIE